MKIISMHAYTGRNIYSHKPVVKMIVDLEEMADTTTIDIPGFNARLLDMFPGLNHHCCSTGHEGGFVERLYEGTYLSHVTEHLALELQCVNGYDVHFGKTRILKEPSTYCIIYESGLEGCALEFGRTAVDIVLALAENQPELAQDYLDDLHRIAGYYDLGPSTRAIMSEARKRHIPVRRLNDNSLLQLGYGINQRLIEASLPDRTSCIAVDIAKDKQLVKDLLSAHSLPVPAGCLVYSEENAVQQADKLGYPVVIKPYDANQGKGVTANIDDEDMLRQAYRWASQYTSRVALEKHIPGRDYRILVVGNKVAAVAERRPPTIVGDGIHTIAQLVAHENQNPLRGTGHEKPMTRIRLDESALDLLNRQGLDIDSIPEVGEIIHLRENGNLSTGGSARDCTGEIHPDNRDLAVRAAQVIGLEVAGIDMVCPDISEPLNSASGAIIEVNAAPGLRMHLCPSEGEGLNVAAHIIDHMYPEGIPFSIPVVSITGTNGKTTVTRMVSHVLSLTGKTVGVTCSSGTYVGGRCIQSGDHTGPRSAQSVLCRQDVEAAVLETARGGIIRKGLGYDLADVGVVINVGDDHLGLDGINTLEDLAFAKGLVVEAVKSDGYAVINGDDDMAEYLARGIRCSLIYFSQNRNNPIIEQHINEGKIAVVGENGYIMVYWQGYHVPMIEIADIPITYGGNVICNIENSLAAVACLFALGVPDHMIKLGLSSFLPDPAVNAGRFNLFDLGNFQVLLDYAHNLSGYQSVIQFLNASKADRRVGIIGMPGDRLDQSILDVGVICGKAFTRLYIKEDHDLRGRMPGETANLLFQGAVAGGARIEDIQIILSETEALTTAIENAYPGDLIVMLYEKFEEAHAIITSHMGRPAADLSLEQAQIWFSSC